MDNETRLSIGQATENAMLYHVLYIFLILKVWLGIIAECINHIKDLQIIISKYL